jgi:hypothetical protein
MYDSSACRRCRSPSTTMWSKHSRRIEPISRSAYPFRHGDRADSVDLVCPSHGHAGGILRRKHDRDHGRCIVEPAPNHRPLHTGRRSIRRSGARWPPSIRSVADHAAGLASHTEVGTRSSAPRTGPSQRCHQHDCAERSSTPGTLSSSPWIGVAPQSGLARLRSRIN